MILEVNGIDLNFQVLGQGEPVIVLHGWADKGSSWYNFAEKLQEEYQLFLIDLPGFGDSEQPKEAWGVKEYSDCISSFIELMEIKNPYFIGHSNGGKIAASLIASGESVKGLMLVSAAGVDKQTFTVKLKIYFFKTIKFVFSKFGKWGEKVISSFRSKLGSTDYKQSGTMRPTIVKLLSYKLFNILHKIKVPTLIVWGQRDEQLNFSQAKIFRKLIPNSYIKLCWEGGHHLHMFNTDELVKFFKEYVSLKESFNE